MKDNRSNIYDETFFENIENMNMDSATEIVSYINEIVNPTSVIDFGCGVGCWLKSFSECPNVNNILGLDGNWLKGKKTLIPNENIMYIDLEREFSLNLNDQFDLAICLEVAEHIDERYADNLIKELILASKIVLFSAAIPQQGGTGHVNEQWQSYWINKFEKHNYKCFDIIRPRFWNNEKAGIYRQNMFLFVSKDKINDVLLAQKKDVHDIEDIVHPMLYSQHKVGRRFSELYLNERKSSRKYIELFNLMADWMSKEISCNGIEQYFMKNNIKTIAIYGMGRIGRLIAECLKGSSVDIKYAIDMKVVDIENIEVYQLNVEKNLPCVQAIVITTFLDYEIIENELSIKTDAQIIDFRDVVKNLMKEN